MNQPIQRNRFMSEWKESSPLFPPQSSKINHFFPKTPKISTLEICEDPEELLLDEPLSPHSRARALKPLRTVFGNESSVQGCHLPNVNSSVDSFEIQIHEKKDDMLFNESKVLKEEKKTLECENLENIEDECLLEDNLSIVCVLNDFEKEDENFRDFFKLPNSDSECIGKRDFKGFSGKINHLETTNNNFKKEVDYDLKIQKEVTYTKNLLKKLFDFQHNSFENSFQIGRRRCKSIDNLGGRRILNFMRLNKK